MAVDKDWAWLDKITGEADEDFIAAVNQESPQQYRPALDFFDRLDDPAEPDEMDQGPAA